MCRRGKCAPCFINKLNSNRAATQPATLPTLDSPTRQLPGQHHPSRATITMGGGAGGGAGRGGNHCETRPRLGLPTVSLRNRVTRCHQMLGAAPAARRQRGVSTIYPRQINKPVLGPRYAQPSERACHQRDAHTEHGKHSRKNRVSQDQLEKRVGLPCTPAKITPSNTPL